MTKVESCDLSIGDNKNRFVVEKRPVKMLNFFEDMPLY